MSTIDFSAIAQVLETAQKEGRDTLLEYEVYQILKAGQVSIPQCVLIKEEREIAAAMTNFTCEKVVVKVASTAILHKTDMGGVQFAQGTPAEVTAACRTIWENVTKAGYDRDSVRIQISEFIPYEAAFGRELLVSFRDDPAFGPILNFGLGGIDTEFFGKHLEKGKSLAVRSTQDLTDEGIRGMIDQVVVSPKLTGQARGQKRGWIDLEDLVHLLKMLSEIAEKFSLLNPDTPFTITEFEINPLVITNDGRLVAIDGLAKLTTAKFSGLPRPIHKIKQLLQPASTLVVGASGKSMNPGRVILRNLIAGGGVNPNRIYVLHPTETEIDGCRCYPTLVDIPENVDMAVVTVPASRQTIDLMREMVNTGKVASITLITSGFGETDAGKDLEVDLQRLIDEGHRREDGGTLVNGPNCLGIISQPGQYNTFFLPEYKLPRPSGTSTNLAAISQSGAYLVTQISNLNHVISHRYAISYGNQIDVTVTDYLEFLQDDDETAVFCLYMEGLKPYDGRRFLRAAQKCRARGQKIVVYKTGRTEAGAKAAASHTASIAGDFEVLRQLLLDAGVYLADNLDDFEDSTKTFALLADKKAVGDRLGIITNAGFEATVSSDNIAPLKLAAFSEDTVTTLAQKLPRGIIDFRNPVDTSPIADTNAFLTTVEAMLADPQIDCLVVSNVPVTPALNTLPAGEGHHENIEDENSFPQRLIRAFKATDKPMVAAVDSGAIYDPCVRMMEAAGIPTFRRIDRAVRALARFVAVS